MNPCENNFWYKNSKYATNREAKQGIRVNVKTLYFNMAEDEKQLYGLSAHLSFAVCLH